MKSNKLFRQLASKLFPEKADERGVYTIFVVIIISFLLVAIGFAIDSPRQITANQRTGHVAEESARYAVSVFVNSSAATFSDRFSESRAATERFIGHQNSVNLSLSLRNFRCDFESNSVTVEVRGIIRNTLSGALLGRHRVFDREASAGLRFISPGGDIVETGICNLT